MQINITYPPVPKRKIQRRKFLNIIKWPVLAAAISCVIVNIAVGGKAWSIIAIMGIYMVWTLLLSPSLVEYNRISQTIKFILYSCLMLILINAFLVPGWAVQVVPMVCFGGLIVSAILFFTDIERQKQNMLPMLLLILVSIVGAAAGIYIWHNETIWPLIVMGAVAFALLTAVIVILRKDFIREIQRRFHVK